MRTLEPIIVFDLLDIEYPDFGFLWFGLMFAAIGLLYNLGKKKRKVFSGIKRYDWIFGLFLWGGLFWMLGMSIFSYEELSRAKKDYLAGNYETIEGLVTDYRLSTRNDIRSVSFSVKKIRFSYSDFDTSPGFKGRQPNTGILKNGVWVRIRYIDDMIVRVSLGPKTLGQRQYQTTEKS